MSRDTLRRVMDAVAELHTLDRNGLGLVEPEVAMEAVHRYDLAARAHVGLVSCSRCGEDSYIKHGRFHQSYYTATCARCLYVNLRPIPEGVNP